MSATRQQAQQRLTEVQARLYQLAQEEKELTNEARTIAGFINLSIAEDREKAEAAKAQAAEAEVAKADPKPETAEESPTAKSDEPAPEPVKEIK